MNDWFELYRPRRDGLKSISIAVVVSLLIHAGAGWWRVPMRFPAPGMDLTALTEAGGSLSVQLVPRFTEPHAWSPPPPVISSRRPPATHSPSVRRPPRPRLDTPMLALKQAAPKTAAPPPAESVSAPPPAAARPSADGDLSSYIEARRRARGESAASVAANTTPDRRPQPPEDENAQASRIAAANLAAGPKEAFGYDPSRTGGVFRLDHVGSDYAEFMFFGWDKNIHRKAAQIIEVRKGDAADIRIAVVRKMIAIIRDHEQGDFLWESYRLGRTLKLSARQGDNAGLEEFMLREFF